MEAESAEAADIPIHILGRYECADGGVINPVGVLDSSLDAEVVEGHHAAEESLGREAADDADDTDIGADRNLPQSMSPSVRSSAATGYSPPHFKCLSSCSMFLRGLRGNFYCFCHKLSHVFIMLTSQYIFNGLQINLLAI